MVVINPKKRSGDDTSSGNGNNITSTSHRRILPAGETEPRVTPSGGSPRRRRTWGNGGNYPITPRHRHGECGCHWCDDDDETADDPFFETDHMTRVDNDDAAEPMGRPLPEFDDIIDSPDGDDKDADMDDAKADPADGGDDDETRLSDLEGSDGDDGDDDTHAYVEASPYAGDSLSVTEVLSEVVGDDGDGDDGDGEVGEAVKELHEAIERLEKSATPSANWMIHDDE